MWEWFVETLRHHPEMALFLTLALGYAIGKVRLGGVTLGAVVGVLIAGVIIGQLGVKLSADLKTAFFLLFLFAIGYRSGPQFFSGLRASGLPQVALTVILAGSALAVGYALARAFGFDPGTAAGLIAGALSESAAVGTGTDAINRLALASEAKQELISNTAVAFAVTYFLGVLTTITVVARIGPKLLGADLEAECKALEKEMGMAPESGPSGYRPFSARAYRVERDRYAGQMVGEIERTLESQGRRAFILRVRRGGAVLDASPTTRLERGDIVALAGRRSYVIPAADDIGPEVDDAELLDFPVDVVDVVLTSPQLAGKTIGEVRVLAAEDRARGVGVQRITRVGAELPLADRTVLARGDIVRLVGHRPDVERVAREVGYMDRPTDATDMVAVGAFIFMGGLIGIPALLLGKVEIGLSQSVGVLVGGLVLGWLRSVNRRFARIPEGALWFFDSVGLATFLAATALAAGPDFVGGLRKSGLSLVMAGLVLSSVPLLLTLLAGRFVFRMHPGILLGVCCGATTSAPSLAAVQEIAKSKIPTLGYGVSYAVGNVLLALWGSIMVALTYHG